MRGCAITILQGNTDWAEGKWPGMRNGWRASRKPPPLALQKTSCVSLDGSWIDEIVAVLVCYLNVVFQFRVVEYIIAQGQEAV